MALTSLRNIIGQHELDEVLKERDKINDKLRAIVDEATDPWGVNIEMVEMKDVEIPDGMQRAMAREAEAMREKRARASSRPRPSWRRRAKLAEAAATIIAQPARPRTAAHADDLRGRRRAQHDDDHHDAVGVRHGDARAHPVPGPKEPGRVELSAAFADLGRSDHVEFLRSLMGPLPDAAWLALP